VPCTCQRRFQFKCQLDEIDARERDAAREARLKCDAVTVAEEKATSEPIPALATELPVLGCEEWLPAGQAVERAERAGLPVTLGWLSRPPRKSGVRTRPRELPGNHQREVEWYSLAGYLAKIKAEETDIDDPGSTERAGIEVRMNKAAEKKRQDRSLD
jgi:hypothetical protein